jgi:hypothetical protein
LGLGRFFAHTKKRINLHPVTRMCVKQSHGIYVQTGRLIDL